MDANGRGELDYGEFVAVSLHLQRTADDEHLRKAFAFFDKDGNGYIEAEELRDALAEDGADDGADVAGDILREVDTDKVRRPPLLLLRLVFGLHRHRSTSTPGGICWATQDGRISYAEFVAMMKTGTDWRKASRHYSRGRLKSLSVKLMRDGSLNSAAPITH